MAPPPRIQRNRGRSGSRTPKARPRKCEFHLLVGTRAGEFRTDEDPVPISILIADMVGDPVAAALVRRIDCALRLDLTADQVWPFRLAHRYRRIHPLPIFAVQPEVTAALASLKSRLQAGKLASATSRRFALCNRHDLAEDGGQFGVDFEGGDADVRQGDEFRAGRRCRCAARDFGCAASPPANWRRSPPKSTVPTNSRRLCGRRWAISACSGSPPIPDFGGTGMSYVAHVVRHGGNKPGFRLGGPVPTAPIPISASTRSTPLGHGRAEAEIPAFSLRRRSWSGALAMSESGSGSDVVSMRLRAEKEERTASCSTAPRCGSPTAPMPTRWWSTPRPGPRPRLARHHRLPDRKGDGGFFRSPRSSTSSAMRGSNTGELVFEDVEVPFDNVLGEEGKGVEVLMSGPRL